MRGATDHLVCSSIVRRFRHVIVRCINSLRVTNERQYQTRRYAASSNSLRREASNLRLKSL